MADYEDDTDTKSSRGSDKLDKWHCRAKSDFDKAYTAAGTMRRLIIEAARFVQVAGAQWEGSTNAGWAFDDDRFEKYPRFELNKVGRECNRIISEYRKNRIAVKFRPKTGDASEELSDKMNGKFRADVQETSGEEAFDNAFSDAVTGGMGCFRLDAILENEHDPADESKRIHFLPVYDPASSVYFDQDSKQYDRSDACWAMEVFSMSPDAFEKQYPDASLDSLETEDDGKMFDWCTPESVYVGRYYEKKLETVTVTEYTNNITQDRAVYDDEEIESIAAELTEPAFTKGKSRKIKKSRIYCGLMSGSEWLEEPTRIPGECIPLIPVYGRRAFVDNQERITGHASDAMDAQRLENLMVSMVADNATQSGGDNIPIVDVDMIPGPLAQFWGERNTKRPAYLPMRSMKDKLGNIVAQAQVAGYTPSTPLSPAVAALLQYTGATIQQITGSSQLTDLPGNIATDTVDSIFNRLDTQSFIYMDNMAKSLKRAGFVWMSMAREVYGTDKPIRIVNEDGSDALVLMNGKVIDKDNGEEIGLNDLTVGRYEVAVDVGQSFANRRDSTVRSLSALLPTLPPGTPMYNVVIGMIIDNMDGEGLEEFKEYNHKQLLLQGVVKPKTPMEQQEVAQAQQEQANQPDPQMVAAQGLAMEGQAKLMDSQTKQLSAQTDAFTAQQDAQLKQAQTVKTVAEAQNIDHTQLISALKLLSDFYNQQQGNARSNAEQMINMQQQLAPQVQQPPQGTPPVQQ
ncbi:MAG: hypothetical protein [Bacteriophage sp.]|nr:MAG: hypothetical protein [Bacteriophage sp.]